MIYPNLPRNTRARLSHPRNGDSPGQEIFLASLLATKPSITICIYIPTMKLTFFSSCLFKEIFIKVNARGANIIVFILVSGIPMISNERLVDPKNVCKLSKLYENEEIFMQKDLISS